jgi:hypothetical protein
MKATMSASASIEPDSRKSLSMGRLSSRCSTARDNCDSAIMGHFNSRAIDLKARAISLISFTRFSALPDECAAANSR